MWKYIDPDSVRLVAAVLTLALVLRFRLLSRSARFLSSWSRRG